MFTENVSSWQFFVAVTKDMHSNCIEWQILYCYKLIFSWKIKRQFISVFIRGMTQIKTKIPRRRWIPMCFNSQYINMGDKIGAWSMRSVQPSAECVRTFRFPILINALHNISWISYPKDVQINYSIKSKIPEKHLKFRSFLWIHLKFFRNFWLDTYKSLSFECNLWNWYESNDC